MDAIGARDLVWSATGTDIFCLPQSAGIPGERRRVPCSAPTVPLAREPKVTDNSVNRATILAAANSLDLTQLLRAIYTQHAAEQAHAAPRPYITHDWTNGGGSNQPWVPPPTLPGPPSFDDSIGDTIVLKPLLNEPNEESGQVNVNVMQRTLRRRPIANLKKHNKSRRQISGDKMEEIIHVRSALIATPMEEVIVVRYPEKISGRPSGRKSPFNHLSEISFAAAVGKYALRPRPALWNNTHSVMSKPKGVVQLVQGRGTTHAKGKSLALKCKEQTKA
ncbi:hypothetical protein EV426DRAFT_572311 [Tirmania nivea]|nr:hypothetical protein EV426DRAFT_572311 [Tirmania nivea]